jgi:cation diffusion facilitator CzcD-associated flavoprotein CzcO
VPSPAYQFSFAPKPDWPKYYSSAADIKEYFKSFAQEHGYTEKYIKLNHEVTKAVWREETGTWRLSITQTLPNGDKRGFEDEVEFLVGNIGVLNTWKWPDIPGREDFRGAMTHSAAYNTDIELKGKRVAVIGSGASTIQIIPAIVDQVEGLVSFYRTPQWISNGLAVEGYTDPEGRNFHCGPCPTPWNTWAM